MTAPGDSRPPLDREVVGAAVGAAGWRLEVVESAESTNAEVARRFRSGEPHGLVLAAEHQTAGRGRLGRGWVTPARTSVTASFLLVPEPDDHRRWPWLPLATGMAAVRAISTAAGVDARLKWPNDVLVGDHKLGGILIERVGRDAASAAVVGIGLNVNQRPEELPVGEATSLVLAGGASVDRSALLGALVAELSRLYDEWQRGVDLRPSYRELCITLGRPVRVLVTGGELTGEAVDVDEGGRLVVRTGQGDEHLAAGDVVHVRPVE